MSRGRDRCRVWRAVASLSAALLVPVAVSGLFTSSAAGSVSPGGAYETAVPIVVPAFHGLQPRLSLSYASDAGDGWIGRGWSLSGLSTISRVSADRGVPRWDGTDQFLLDGQRLVPCPASGSSGAVAASPGCASALSQPNTTWYTTEVEAFRRIARVAPGSGLPYWLVWNTDGTLTTYQPGLVTGSGVYDWRIASVADPSGANVVNYDWSNADSPGSSPLQVPVLKDIRYGDVTITFQSESRPDPFSLALGGALATGDQRLQVIDETAGGSRLRAYALQYVVNSSWARESFLSSVQQYGSDATVTPSGVSGPSSLPAITFGQAQVDSAAGYAWSKAEAQVGGWAANWPAPADSSAAYSTTAGATAAHWELATDLNGDRRSDFVGIDTTGCPSSSAASTICTPTITDEITQPGGGFVEHDQIAGGWSWYVPQNGRAANLPPVVGDVNGDGLGDLVDVAEPSSGSYSVYTAISNGNGSFRLNQQAIPGASSLYQPHWLSGDVNGDGRADLVGIGLCSGGSAGCGGCPGTSYGYYGYTILVGLSAGNGLYAFKPPQTTCWTVQPNTRTPAETVQLADVNGDHRDDLVLFTGGDMSQSDCTSSPQTDCAHIFTGLSTGGGQFDLNHDYNTGLPLSLLEGSVWQCFAGSPGLPCPTPDTYLVNPPLALDVNGDGRADLVAPGDGHIYTFFSAGDGTYQAVLGKTSVTWAHVQYPKNYVQAPEYGYHVGNFTGSGAHDIVAVGGTDASGSGDVGIVRLISDGKGGWNSAPATTQKWTESTCQSGEDCSASTFVNVADVNGDGRDDVVAAHLQNYNFSASVDLTSPYVDSQNPSVPAEGDGQWLVGDAEGDGRQDLLLPLTTANGIQVRELQRTGSGSWAAVAPANVQRFTGDTQIPEASWAVMDVTGSGRADLVSVESGRVVTLLSDGQGGWTPKITSTPGSLPSSGWRVAKLDGSGRDDLYHVDVPTSGALTVSVLAAQPDGTFVLHQDNVADSPVSSFDTLNWFPADVTGDGHADLVHVSSSGSAITVETLLNRDGTWQPANQAIDAGQPQVNANDASWMPMDVNGDGSDDLVNVWTAGGTTYVTTLVSRGDGSWAPVTSSAGQGIGLGGGDWHPAEIAGDPRAALLGFQHRPWGGASDAGALITLLSNGDGTWSTRDKLGPLEVPGQTDWLPSNLDSGPNTTLFAIGQSADQLNIGTFASTAVPDLLSSVTNGVGTTTTVAYLPSTNFRPAGVAPDASLECGLPPGVGSMVVDSVSTTDQPSRTSEDSSERYACPRWSSELRTMLAWRETWTTHAAAVNRPTTIDHITRAVYAPGIVQPVSEEMMDRKGTAFQRTTSEYAPIGGGPPYHDQLNDRVLQECASTECIDAEQTSFTYDVFGNVTRKVEDGGQLRTTDTQYAANTGKYIVSLPRLVTVTGSPGSAALIRVYTCYDGDTSGDCHGQPTRGLPTASHVWDSTTGAYATTKRTYDNWGNLTSTTDPNAHGTTIVYDTTNHLYPVRTCNALHQCTAQPEWDRVAEAPTETVDPNGARTIRAYDPLGRPSSVLYPSGERITSTYEESPSRGTVRTDATTGSGVSQWAKTFTDGLGRTYLTEKEGASSAHPVLAEVRFSDSSNLPWQTAAPHFPGDPPAYQTTEYDQLERPVRVIQPDGSSSTISYGVVTFNPEVPHSPIPPSLSTTSTDETGRKQTQYTDGYGDLLVSAQPGTTGQMVLTHYAYDPLGRLTSVTDPAGNVSSASWNSLGEKTRSTNPDSGATTYTYDTAGNLHSSRDALGRTTTYSYDALNRLTRKRDGNGAVSIWNYDQPGHGASIGRLTSVSDPSAIGCPSRLSRSLVYSRAGDITGDTRCVTGTRLTVRSTYDQLGRPTSVSYPQGRVVQYRYDAAGNLVSVPGYVRALSYDAAGHVVSAAYANGTTGRWSYDPKRQWLLSQQTKLGQKVLYDANYLAHAANGLIDRVTSTTNRMNEVYTYDPLGRLTSARGATSQTIAYDDLGNITFNSGLGRYTYGRSGCGTNCGGPNAVSQAGDQRYLYDAAGETVGMIRAGHRVRSVKWNADGLTDQITQGHQTTRMLYDADGNLVQQTAGRATTKLFGNALEWSPQHGLAVYVYAGPIPVARRQGSVTDWYTLDDGGSPRLITDSHGAPIARLDYGPLGQITRAVGNNQPFGYNGERTAGPSGLIEMAAREYDPQLARMTSADTIVPNLGDPQTLNRYSYAGNNPISFEDPTGHDFTVKQPDAGDGSYCDAGCESATEFFSAADAFSQAGDRAFITPGGLSQYVTSVEAYDANSRQITWLSPGNQPSVNSGVDPSRVSLDLPSLTCDACTSLLATTTSTLANSSDSNANTTTVNPGNSAPSPNDLPAIPVDNANSTPSPNDLPAIPVANGTASPSPDDLPGLVAPAETQSAHAEGEGSSGLLTQVQGGLELLSNSNNGTEFGKAIAKELGGPEQTTFFEAMDELGNFGKNTTAKLIELPASLIGMFEGAREISEGNTWTGLYDVSKAGFSFVSTATESEALGEAGLVVWVGETAYHSGIGQYIDNRLNQAFFGPEGLGGWLYDHTHSP